MAPVPPWDGMPLARQPGYARAVLDHATFHPETVLLSRLRDAASKRQVVVLAGSALTMPVGDIPGVPTTAGIVDMIRGVLADDEDARHALKQALDSAANTYQKAFETLNASASSDRATPAAGAKDGRAERAAGAVGGHSDRAFSRAGETYPGPRAAGAVGLAQGSLKETIKFLGMSLTPA